LFSQGGCTQGLNTRVVQKFQFLNNSRLKAVLEPEQARKCFCGGALNQILEQGPAEAAFFEATTFPAIPSPPAMDS
jgi:hypothetical protein